MGSAIDGVAQRSLKMPRSSGRRRLTAALAMLLASVPTLAFERVTVPNAEDLALLADGRWVIASSMSAAALAGGGGGALYAVDTHNGAAQRLASDRPAAVTGGYGNCAGPVPAPQFGPHGIALRRTAEGGQQLLVVNHGARESVEIYAVEAGDTPTLTWVDCVELPAGAAGNAVAAAGDGRLFVTNIGEPIDGSKPAQRWMNGVLVWQLGGGWGTVAGSQVHGANGLLVSADGTTLFVASWPGNELVKLTIQSDGEPARHTLELPFMPDNLRWGGEGRVLATGMKGDVATVSACVMGKASCDGLTTVVARIDGTAMMLECSLQLPLTMGTVALPVGEQLWVGPVRGDAIWVVPGVELEAACSQ